MGSDSNISSSTYKNIAFAALFFVLGGIISYCMFGGLKTKRNDVYVDIDTVYVYRYDTIKYRVSVERERWRYDTVVVNDTVYIKDEPQHYVDSTESYKVDINAVKLYDYSLDIYRRDTLYQISERVVHTKEKGHLRQFVGIGIGAGYGGCIDPSTRVVNAQPYVGVSVVYGWGYTW